MSLSEYFERFDPETWRDNLGLNQLLFRPKETIDDPKSAAYAWLKNILGVNAGRIGFKSIFEENLTKNRFKEAFDILEYFPEKDQLELNRKLFEQLTKHHSGILQKIESLDRRILEIQGRIISQVGKPLLPLLNEVKEKLQGIKGWIFPGTLSDETLESYESYKKEIIAVEETVILLEMEDKSFLGELFQEYDKVAEKVKITLLNGNNFSKELIEKCFLLLPNLVLNGHLDTLQMILSALQTGNLESLEELELPKGYVSSRKIEYKRQRLPVIIKEREILSVALRPITKSLLDDIPKLDEKFESIEVAREFIDKKTRKAKTFLEAAIILLGGAKAILSMGDKNIMDLQAQGFMELAQYHLSLKHYTYALELFIDSFCTWTAITAETEFLSEDERKTATGILLADWAPKVIALQQNQNILEMANYFFENPTIMLDKIGSGNDFEVIFHSFDQLNDYFPLKRFLKYLEETCPKFDWTAILAERILQPRLFLKKPEKNILQLRVLIEGKYEKIGLLKVIKDIGSVIDAGTLKEKTFGIEISELEREIEKIRGNIHENINADSLTLRNLLEGIDEIVKSIRGKIKPAKEIQFNARPINNVFFLGEKNKGLDFVFAISFLDSSLPTNSFSVDARIERKQKERYLPFVSFQNTKVELGPLEPGSIEETSFILDIDDKILQEFSEVPIELNFREGIKIITPLDRKKIFQISLRHNRKGTRENPYVAGPALEKGSLYVGREQELKKIKSTLIGQSQDNIPLILGIRKVGKTSLLKRLMDDEEIKRKYIPVFIDLQDMPESETTAVFLKKLSERIHERCGEKWKIPFSRSPFDQDPIDAFEKYVLRFNNSLPIPLIPAGCSEGKRPPVPRIPARGSERSDAGLKHYTTLWAC